MKQFSLLARIAFFILISTTLSSCGWVPQSWLAALPVKVASCDRPLHAELRMAAPHWGPPRVDMDVVWEVIASGCTGRYQLREYPQVKPFPAFGHFFRYYGSIQTVKEKVTVQSVDWVGNVLDETVAQAESFVVSPEAPKFLSPPADVRAESVRPRDDNLGCRIEKESKMGPEQSLVNFKLIVDGDHEGANFNGYAAKNGQVFSVPANEYQVYRAIGVVFGKAGHAACQSYFVAPRCQISLVENSFDLVRKKLTALGRVERVVWDGATHVIGDGKDSITVDEVPNRVGKIETQATVYGPEGDEGACAANFTIPSPELKIQPVRAIASSSWKDTKPHDAIDGTTQQGWISRTKGKGWIRIDLGRNFKVSKVRLCIDQNKPGKTKHEVYLGKTESGLRKVANFDDITAAGQWLEKKMDEKDVRFVEVKTLDTNSFVSWREIEVYQCTTFRKCTGDENGTLN